MEGGPESKKRKTDGNINAVDEKILLASKDYEAWIAERRKKWPSAKRIAEKQAEEANRPKPEVSATSPGENRNNNINVKNSLDNNKQGPNRRPICRYYLRGRCASGNRCRFSHEKPARSDQLRTDRVYSRFEAPTKASLFVKLVQSDHDIEDERLLDFIEFLHSNNLL